MVGKTIRSPDVIVTTATERVLEILTKLSSWIDEIPLVAQQQRFGNKAYKTWHERLVNEADSLTRHVLADVCPEASVELAIYLSDSFGNATRIDYGTGHEMAFVVYLCSLFLVGVWKDEDRPAVGLKVFSRCVPSSSSASENPIKLTICYRFRYMDVCRKLQNVYRMEPAGSQGVWNLDDYQFVPFIWGAAQMRKGSQIGPKSIPDYEIANMLADDYHFFACIKHISGEGQTREDTFDYRAGSHSHRMLPCSSFPEVKTGPFAEHSNQLWNVSGVKSWDKVNQGLVKMYRAEVLSKFPVMQHFYFGSLFNLKKAEHPLPPVTTAASGMRERSMAAGGQMLPPMGVMPPRVKTPVQMGVQPGPSLQSSFPRPDKLA